ncbi:hypothetical protein N0V90_000130 [Kalmusia sp. IMI 367209]|nr:hypothetical protein N0V90_000130 [Kalmusia sp. IMI 367209]
MFDTEIQRAIYALPTFDGHGKEYPRRIDPSMTARLILSKMYTKDSEKRPLCLAITRAVDHLQDQFEQKAAGSRLEFTKALAGAASRALPLDDIVDCLVKTPNPVLDSHQRRHERRLNRYRQRRPGGDIPRHPIELLTPSSEFYTDSAPQDALIAAIATEHFQLAIQLLERGVKATTKSPAFGVPLQVAAATGAQEFVQMMLDGILRQAKEGDAETSDMIEDARRFVLHGAAIGGHEPIVRKVLYDLENNPESLGVGLSRPIYTIVDSGHEDMALLLLQHRIPLPLRKTERVEEVFLVRRESNFWRRLSEKAARPGCENILRIALDSKESLNCEADKLYREEIQRRRNIV